MEIPNKGINVTSCRQLAEKVGNELGKALAVEHLVLGMC